MIEVNSDIVGMARAVHYDTSYLYHVSKNDVLSESSFKYPALEWLERQCENVKVGFEKSHPLFSRRRVDIKWELSKVNYFLEMKYAKKETADKSEQQRFFNDIFRLASIAKNMPESQCYFLVSGNSINWMQCFQNIEATLPSNSQIKQYPTEKRNVSVKTVVSSGIYSEWLSFDMENTERTIRTYKNDFYKSFKKDYSFRDKSMKHARSLTVGTRLLWISEQESLENSCMTAVWKVYV